MKQLNYELKKLCDKNRDGSYATQNRRERDLTLCADQLLQLGFRRMGARSVKPKHIESLVKHWLGQKLSPGTIKNRMASLRWWADKVNKRSVIANSNNHYGVPDRRFVTNESKAQQISVAALDKIKDPHVRCSLELQQAFGLRREEAIKIKPTLADNGDHLLLKANWTKGGKARAIPILTEAQRHALERAKTLAGQGSLIPAHRRYVDQRRIYERHSANAGLSRLHGLRHQYAQQRYEDLTSWKAPNAGGPTSGCLTPEQKAVDLNARIMISRELGHGREQITAVYLGR